MIETRLSPQDECDLLWFFSRGTTSFERSTIGGMLERAELYSVARLYAAEQRPVYDPEGRRVGFLTGITARPTAETRAPSGYTPKDHVLHKYAKVSAALARVERASPLSARVLEALLGDLGEHWATLEPHGRIGSLFHLTAKGQQLLAADARRATGLSTVQRMENIVHQHTAQPNAARRAALARCQAQARELEHTARVVWQEVSQQAAA
jgi:hypothetical protein